MKPKKNQELELKVDSLVYGGEGIGTVDGFKVFVPNVAPGDEALVQIRRVKSHYAEGFVKELKKPSPLRIEARCKHFGVCGGCKWQFLDYAEQCRVKEQQVKDALVRIGGLNSDLVKPLVPNASPWFYRNKLEFSFGIGGNGETELGFYPPGYHYEVFDLEECFLQSEWVVSVVQKVRAFVKYHAIPVYNSHTHEGLLKTLTVREGKNTGERMIILTTSTGLFEKKDAFIELFADDPTVTSLYWNSVYQIPGQPTWVEENLLTGKAALTEVLELENGTKLEFDILPQAFFQTNTLQAQKLYSLAMELAGLTGEEIVYDLYCGTGTIGLFVHTKPGAYSE
ncbi:23S rRNA (uracil(1939)-C(5))-methyltransferase RlmD [Candidatus Peregrinibacteria bacterium]|nr:MAG: 23S rRNA (uracil(1939)-C(5))-methyltransferase RlmD [Candidatus Peregrinibacteria bacterium]